MASSLERYLKMKEQNRTDKKKSNKYRAKRVTGNGYSFASKGEAACDQLLCLMEKAGEIRIKKRQAVVYLSRARIMYVPDWMIENLKTGQDEYVEFKGFETPEWRIKRKLWMYYGPAPLTVYKGSARHIFVHEIIIPNNSEPDIIGIAP